MSDEIVTKKNMTVQVPKLSGLMAPMNMPVTSHHTVNDAMPSASSHFPRFFIGNPPAV